MKRLIALLILLCSSLWATNWTVKQAGGGNYSTIGQCASDARTVAGDTCTVYAGNYAEYPTLSKQQVTYTVNPGDTVQVYGFYITGNYVSVIGTCTVANTPGCGFLITDPGTGPTHTGAFTHTTQGPGIKVNSGVIGTVIRGNTFTQVGLVSSSTQVTPGSNCLEVKGASQITITGNIFSWCSSLSSQQQNSNPTNTTTCSNPYIYPPTPSNGGGLCNSHMSSAIALKGDHILFSGNDISHVTNAIQFVAGLSYVVVRDNTIHDIYVGQVDQNTNPSFPNEWDAFNCAELNNCDTHIDIIESSGGSVSNVLIENNTVSKIWGSGGAHMWFASSTTATDQYWISRFNKGYQVGSAYLNNEVATSAPYGVLSWKDYNNSYIVSNQQNTNAPQQNPAACGPTQPSPLAGSDYDFSLVNDIFYNVVNPAGTLHTIYYTIANQCTATAGSTVTTGNNMVFDSSCSQGTLADCTGGLVSSDGSTFQNPKLIATDGTNYGLQAGSPAIGAGRALTTVASGCTGSPVSTLVLSNSKYFQDGWAPGVTADTIRIGASSLTTITSNTQSTNTVTFSPAVTCTGNPNVYLSRLTGGSVVLLGSAPDTGGGIPANNPSVVTIHCLGNGTSSASGFDVVDGNSTHVTATCNNGAATCTAGSPDGTGSGCQGNYPNSDTLTITATAGVGSAVSALTGGGCVGSPCTSSTGTGDVDFYSTFTTSPTCTIALSQNSVNAGGSVTVTSTATNVPNQQNSSVNVLDPNGKAIITSTFPFSGICSNSGCSGNLPFTASGFYSFVACTDGVCCDQATAPLNIGSPSSWPSVR